MSVGSGVAGRCARLRSAECSGRSPGPSALALALRDRERAAQPDARQRDAGGGADCRVAPVEARLRLNVHCRWRAGGRVEVRKVSDRAVRAVRAGWCGGNDPGRSRGRGYRAEREHDRESCFDRVVVEHGCCPPSSRRCVMFWSSPQGWVVARAGRTPGGPSSGRVKIGNPLLCNQIVELSGHRVPPGVWIAGVRFDRQASCAGGITGGLPTRYRLGCATSTGRR